MPLGLMPGMNYEEKEVIFPPAMRCWSTAMAWWKRTIHSGICLVFRASGASSAEQSRLGDRSVRHDPVAQRALAEFHRPGLRTGR